MIEKVRVAAMMIVLCVKSVRVLLAGGKDLAGRAMPAPLAARAPGHKPRVAAGPHRAAAQGATRARPAMLHCGNSLELLTKPGGTTGAASDCRG
jgi:hypothetical protein